MADDKKEKVEKPDKAAKAPEAEAAPKKKSPLMLIIIIVVAGLVIGGGGAVTIMMLKGDGEDTQAKPSAAETQKIAPKPTMLGPIIALDSFIVNLSGSGGRNYLKVDISLELSDPALQQEISNKLPKIRDVILLILSTKTFDDVKTSQGKIVLKDDILMRLNDALTSGKVVNLYFTSFVVQ